MSLPVAGVAGWPVEHSRSPVVHEFWLKTYGLGGEYQLFAVPPEQLSAFFQRIVDGQLVGTNVTVPRGAGLGVTLDEAKLKKYTVDSLKIGQTP